MAAPKRGRQDSEAAAMKRFAKQQVRRVAKAGKDVRKLLDHNHQLTRFLQAIVNRSGRERVTYDELDAIKDVPSLLIDEDIEAKCFVFELAEGFAGPLEDEPEGEVTEDA